uniref:HTH psq-type domain-containing protein n=2 Tax=Panagrolaimus sp. JU765 TaxID=591449 RepID=A0AC34RKA7_9BILA
MRLNSKNAMAPRRLECLEQICLQFVGRRRLKKLHGFPKEPPRSTEDWKQEERCEWCDGSRIGVEYEPLTEDFDIVPEIKKLTKKKTEPELFIFDNIPKSSTVPDCLNYSLFPFGAFFNPLFPMPNAMFPNWPNQVAVNNNNKFPQSLPQLDTETMQKYMTEWQNQFMNANMMSYFLRAPNVFNPQFGSNSLSVAQQQLMQQFQNSSRNSFQGLKPFVLKDPPKKNGNKMKEANALTDGQDEPLDLSAKKMQTFGKVVEDDQTSAGSLELNDKSSSPECNEAGSKLTKRNYTQQALNDAVSEILSGRLGTRRASVVYGIPRSTLRNKIYKLESIDEISSELKRRRAKKNDDESKNNILATKPVREDDEVQPVPLQKTSSMPSMESPSILPFGPFSSNPSLLAQLPGNLQQLGPTFTDLLKQYVGTKHDNKESSTSPPAENSSDELEKRPRPKRGQYRKYDKCALEKAVLSVRKGEMSVHRAGSFYGVPHSTLEYKVKERNLLRGKRRFNGDKKADDEDQDVLQKALSMNSLESVENQCSSDVKSECDA